jgi:hypothetical protein
MQFSFLHPFKLRLRNEHSQEPDAIHVPKHDESEGGEFLDDTVRHEELPVSNAIDNDAE